MRQAGEDNGLSASGRGLGHGNTLSLASDVSESLRRFVAERAALRCEYCLLHQSDSYSPHQIDHIISRKHGSQSDSDHLPYACLRSNAWKGSDAGSLNRETA